MVTFLWKFLLIWQKWRFFYIFIIFKVISRSNEAPEHHISDGQRGRGKTLFTVYNNRNLFQDSTLFCLNFRFVKLYNLDIGTEKLELIIQFFLYWLYLVICTYVSSIFKAFVFFLLIRIRTRKSTVFKVNKILLKCFLDIITQLAFYWILELNFDSSNSVSRPLKFTELVRKFSLQIWILFILIYQKQKAFIYSEIWIT